MSVGVCGDHVVRTGPELRDDVWIKSEQPCDHDERHGCGEQFHQIAFTVADEAADEFVDQLGDVRMSASRVTAYQS